ncbi:MAG: hypothetical protein QG556_938 [Pseudomonadota bacterium]|nr:hypothetical protein [Pseudomonadota bacterium]
MNIFGFRNAYSIFGQMDLFHTLFRAILISLALLCLAIFLNHEWFDLNFKPPTFLSIAMDVSEILRRMTITFDSVTSPQINFFLYFKPFCSFVAILDYKRKR